MIRFILDVRNKNKITQELLHLIPDHSRPSLEKVLPVWWFNLRKNGGLRLTTTGYKTFVDLNIDHYTYEINDPHAINQKLILNLDRKLQMPYYIHAVKGIPKRIVFFGSREAMLARLYGDLDKFLSNY